MKNLLRVSLFCSYLILLTLCGEDFYKLLEISREAKDQEIKKAFRRMSLKYHPDKIKGFNILRVRE